MTLFGTFSRKYPNTVFIAVVLGIVAGILYSLLIPTVINAVMDTPDIWQQQSLPAAVWLTFEIAHERFAWTFLILCAGIFVCRLLSRMMLSSVAMSLTAQLRIQLSRMVTDASVADLERIGPSRLTSVLMEDVSNIVYGGQILPMLLTNLATLAGTLGFLFYLSPDAFWLVLQAIGFGIITYQIPLYFCSRMYRRSRALYDEVQEAVRGLIYGAKELNLNSEKRAHYFSDILVANQWRLTRNDQRANTIFITAGVYGDLIGFFVIGIVAFVFVNYHVLSTGELISVVMAIIYLTGPTAFIMNTLPQLTTARIALSNVHQLLGEMRAVRPETATTRAPPWDSIDFEDVCYRHSSDTHHDGFMVGPLSFTIRKGEITFIVGGNGSGKSTLAKLITLHYGASSGNILFSGHAVEQSNLEMFRQEIGAIFSDYYLFRQLLTDVSPKQQALIDEYLDQLGLRGKVQIENGQFSTLRLSDGQRRRLALLAALLDDKPLYLFDEWAADQDPVFKQFFYHQVLPRLRDRGKAIIVISHDDRYFEVADRVIVMESGKIIAAQLPSAMTAAEAKMIEGTGEQADQAVLT